MKTLRQELSAEGRTDILQQVMAYRGGYSQEVSSLVSLNSVGLPIGSFLLRIAAGSKRKPSPETCSESSLPTLWNLAWISVAWMRYSCMDFHPRLLASYVFPLVGSFDTQLMHTICRDNKWVAQVDDREIHWRF